MVCESQVTNPDLIGPLTMAPVKIGRHASFDETSHTADFSELALVFGSVSVQQILQVETYLGQKYNISINNESCSPGTYYSIAGLARHAACQLCGPGAYSNETGLIQFSIRFPNNMIDSAGSTVCKVCQAGTYSTTGRYS